MHAVERMLDQNSVKIKGGDLLPILMLNSSRPLAVISSLLDLSILSCKMNWRIICTGKVKDGVKISVSQEKYKVEKYPIL